MGKKLEGNTYRRAVRELIADIDYVGKLSEAEREWLEVFIDATAGNNTDAQAALTGTPKKFEKLYAECYAESNARGRDLMGKFSRAPFLESPDSSVGEEDDWTIEAMAKTRSEFFKHYRCSRCLAPAEKCDCPRRQRNSPYGMEDYTPIEECEDTMIAAVDAKRRIAAYDLLPYGDNPPGLKVGHAVKVCLPHHLFKNAWGVVIDVRPAENSYLVEVRSKHGLRDRDGELPKQALCWVPGEGLKRYRPQLAANQAN